MEIKSVYISLILPIMALITLVVTSFEQSKATLFTAMKQDNLALFKQLLIKGADPNQLTYDNLSPLIIAVQGDQYEFTKLLLEYKAKTQVTDHYNKNTPLHIAARKSGNLVKLLLEYQADPNAQNGEQETPLHIAVRNNNAQAVRLLLQYKASPEIANNDAKLPLNEALKTGNLEIIRLLLPKNFDFKNDPLATELLAQAVQSTTGAPAVEFLLSQGVSPNLVYNQQPILLTAVAHTENIEVLLKNKADPNATDAEGMTALMKAAANGYDNAAELLVLYGADIKKRNNKNQSALMISIYKGNHSITTLLLGKDAHLQESWPNGDTVLTYAAQSNPNYEIISLLLEKKVDVNAQNQAGKTALMIVAGKRSASMDIVELLVSHGADVDKCDHQQHNAIWYAKKAYNFEIQDYLLQKSKNPNQQIDTSPDTSNNYGDGLDDDGDEYDYGKYDGEP